MRRSANIPLFAISSLLCTVIALSMGAINEGTGFTAEERLSQLFVARAYGILDDPDLGEGEFFCARGLAAMAVRLTPDLECAWRLRLAVEDADIADPNHLESVRTAITNLAKLDPSDQQIRLRRVLEAVETRNTAQERVAAYRKLLEPAALQALGNEAGARVAHDLAMLESRLGNWNAFATQMARAAELDPYYPDAAEALAGFVAGSEESVVHHADLLSQAYICNPSDPTAPTRLGALLMANRAWTGVQQAMDLSLSLSQVNAVDYTTADGYVVEQALALWAQGKGSEAMRELREYVAYRDDYYQRQLVSSGVSLTQAEISKEAAPQGPELAIAFAAIAADLREPDADSRRELVVEGLRSLMAAAKRETEAGLIPDAFGKMPDPATVAGTLSQIQAQSLNLWFALCVMRADAAAGSADLGGLAGEIEGIGDLPATTRDRIAALSLLASGEFEQSLAALQALVEPGPLETFAKGIALDKLGRRRESAAAFKATYELAPGTLIGVGAERKLARLLGLSALPPGPENAALAAAVARIPAQLSQVAAGKNGLITYEIRAHQPTTEPFDPIMMDIVVINNLDRPLAFEPTGPLRPLVTLAGDVAVPNITKEIEIDTSILRIDRQLNIGAHQRMAVPLDLRLVANIEEKLALEPLLGALIEVHSILNFITTGRTLRPGVLGAEGRSPTVMVPPTPVTNEWLEGAIKLIQDPSNPRFLPTLALIAHAAARDESKTDQAEIFQRAKRGWAAFAEAWRGLDGVQRAWLIAAGPGTASGFSDFVREAAQSPVGYQRVAAALHARQTTERSLDATGVTDPDAKAVIDGMRALLARRAAEAANTRREE